MLKCKKCGAAISLESSVCSQCGEKIRVNRKSGAKSKSRRSNYDKTKKAKTQKDDSVDIMSESQKPNIYSHSTPSQILSNLNDNDDKAKELSSFPKKKNIYSTSDFELNGVVVETPKQKKIYSSNKSIATLIAAARRAEVMAKIGDAEKKIGDTSDNIVIEEQKKVVPTVVRRESQNAIIDSFNNRSKKKAKRKIKDISSGHKNQEDSSKKEDTTQPTDHKNPEKQDLPKKQNSDDYVFTGLKTSVQDIKKEKRSSNKTKKSPKSPAEISSEKTAVDEKPTVEKPVKKVKKPKPVETPTVETSVDEKPTVEKPVKKVKNPKPVETPTAETAVDEKPTVEKPVKKVKKPKPVETPTVETAVDEKPTVEKPVKKVKKPKPVETPTVETAVDEKPTVEKPVKKVKKLKPVETPTAETAVDEKPTVEKPVKKVKKQQTEKPKSRKIPEVEIVEKDGKKAVVTKPIEESEFSSDDVEKNKIIAGMAYLGVLIIAPLTKKEESEFCKAHVKQGAVVFIYSLIVELLSLMLVLALRFVLAWQLGVPMIVYRVLLWAVGLCMMALVFIPAFKGALGAFRGKYEKIEFLQKFMKE